jgi:hypothetical protein
MRQFSEGGGKLNYRKCRGLRLQALSHKLQEAVSLKWKIIKCARHGPFPLHFLALLASLAVK